MASDNKLVISINGTAKDFLDEIDKVKKQTASLDKVLTKTAKASALAFAGFASSIAVVVKSFADYEKALVGVGKTTNIEGKRLASFGKEFQKLSSTIPVSTNDLLGIAQAAGQLGVSGEQNLIKFTDTIAKLGVATDLTGEQAAISLTRILNVTKESISTIDNFGSVIVALGNNFAATESEIVKSTTEVARATTVFNVSASQAAALATALKSVGVQSELGGSAVGRAFREIDKATREGGAALENLSRVTGIAGEDLRKTFEEDSTRVFQAFVEGLGRIDAAGGSTTKALEAFNLKGDEILKVLPVLAKNSELLGKTLKVASDETRNATALNAEAAKAFNTLSSEAQRTANNFENLKTNIGEQLAPQITELLKGLNGVIKSIAETDKSTLSAIASFLKWGGVISGVVASTTAFLLGAIKLSAIIGGLSAVFLPATIAASGFWLAVTGPIGIAVAGVAALTAGFFALKASLSEPETQGLDQINSKLEEQRKALERNKKIAEESGKDPSQSIAVKQIQDRIDKLEELRQKQIETSKDFGTGELLVRPTSDGTNPLADFDAGISDQEIPLAAPEQQGEAAKESLKANEEAKQAIVDEATQKRIEAAKAENEQLLALQKERNEGSTEQELESLQRKQEIENEFAEARKIKDQELRQLALENLNLKHEEELASIEEFEAAKDERAAERLEERAALDEEIRELSKEQQAQFDEEDRARLAENIDTQKEAEKKASEQKLQRQIQERNQFKQDEIKFGTTIANLKEFFNKEEVQGVKSTSAQLAQLSRSRNSTLKGIGKAAARVNAAIATAEGAIKAYTSLAGIPIIGPVLGAAAAGALIAFGVEQQQTISSAATGGFVPPTSGGARDRVPTLLEPNELVVPAAIAPNFIQAAGIPDTQAGQNIGDQDSSGTPVIEIMLQDRAGEVISLEQREGRSLGLIGDS